MGSGAFSHSAFHQRPPTSAALELRLHASAAGQPSNALEPRDPSVLPWLARADDAENEWRGGCLHVCEGCGATNTLLLETAVRSSPRGAAQIRRMRLIPHLLLRKDEAQWSRSAVFGA